jgi:hypothetical protein
MKDMEIINHKRQIKVKDGDCESFRNLELEAHQEEQG